MWDCLLDAFLDTLKIAPVLLLVYLLVSYLGHHNNEKYRHFMEKTSRVGPIMGSVLGIVPQCGFSSVMADMYSKKSITMGTLIAVFLATSDEALPILLGNFSSFKWLGLLVAIKFVSAILFGFLVDGFISMIKRKKIQTCNVGIIEKDEHEHCEHDHCCADNIFVDALKHSLKILAFIFVATIIMNIAIYYVGTDNLANVMAKGSVFQPLIAGVIGLIPNCAASVLLVELFLQGGISFASCVAGLSVGSGVGLLVLFRQNKNWKQNLLIMGLCYVFGVVTGMLCLLLPI